MISEKFQESNIWEKEPYYLKVFSYLIAESEEGSVSTTPEQISTDTYWFSRNKYRQLNNSQVVRVLDFLEKENYINVRKMGKELNVKITKLLIN